MDRQKCFSHLYHIAKNLNQEFLLHSALTNSLEKTCEVLDISTGWIWLTEPDQKSVYLACSYNLPPALKNNPERLSGWCYCIEKYFSGDIDQAVNISEIACTRLKDIVTGTNDLKFHATIPINVQGEKVGLLNLLTKKSKKIREDELILLNTVSELIGSAIQRIRLVGNQKQSQYNVSSEVTNEFLIRRIERISEKLGSNLNDRDKLIDIQKEVNNIQIDLDILVKETEVLKKQESKSAYRFPQTPLSKRELEVLNLIKKGFTNKEIGKQLYVTERTVKFHITSILAKLRVNNRTQAVDVALKRGFLSM